MSECRYSSVSAGAGALLFAEVCKVAFQLAVAHILDLLTDRLGGPQAVQIHINILPLQTDVVVVRLPVGQLPERGSSSICCNDVWFSGRCSSTQRKIASSARCISGTSDGGHIQPRTDVGHLLGVLQHGHGPAGAPRWPRRGRFPAAGVGHADVRRDALLGKVALLLAVAAARSGLKRPLSWERMACFETPVSSASRPA